jgi:hypothetical protein
VATLTLNGRSVVTAWSFDPHTRHFMPAPSWFYNLLPIHLSLDISPLVTIPANE